MLKRGRLALVLCLAISIFLVSAVVASAAADVAYLYRKDFRIDENVIDVFEELGLSVELINEKQLPKDFSQYNIIFVGDEKFLKDHLIPVNSFPSVIANHYHGEDFGLTDREGVSKLASASPLSVVKNGQKIQVYTSSDGMSMPSIGYYFIDMENEADSLRTVALTEETSSGAKFGDVIAYADAGSRMENGKIQEGNLCFFGITESDFWTPQAKSLFKDCVGFVADECQTDNDCSEPEFSEPFCQNDDVYTIKTSYSCELVGMNQCVSGDNLVLVEECEFGCQYGECLDPFHDVSLIDFEGAVNKVKIETIAGQVIGANDKLNCFEEYKVSVKAKNIGEVSEELYIFDGYIDFQNGEEISFQQFLSGEFLGVGDTVVKSKTLNLEGNSGSASFDIGIFPDEDDVLSNNFAVRNAVVFCPVCSTDDDCDDNDTGTEDICHNPGEENATCTNEEITCSVNTDCGVDGFTGSRMCNLAGDVTQEYVSYMCNNGGTAESFCTSSTETRLIEECSDLCVNGQCAESECNEDSDCEDSNPLTYDQCLNPGTVASKCVNTEINCAANSDCGFTGFLGNEFCSANTIQKNFQNSTCLNPGTLSSSCSVSVAPKDITQCEFACTSGTCIVCDQNSDCNDDDSETIDACVNPGTVQSFCSNDDFDVDEIVCTKNSDCGTDTPLQPLFCSVSGDVGQLVLTHQCNNANTTSSYCSTSTETRTVEECTDLCQNGACVNVECYNNADCSDGNSTTQDTCHSPGTPQSYCTNEHLQIECYTDGECGTDGFLGQSFCSDGDVARLYKDFECNAAGTPLSFCSSSTYPKLIEQCEYSCSQGLCQPQEEIECSSNSECGTSGFVGNPFCVNDDIYRNYQGFMCLLPGSSQSYCTSNVEGQLTDTCQYACNDGSCVRCDENSDCSDGNAGTSDVCLMPDTALSYCQNEPIGECTPGETRSCGQTSTGQCKLGTETCDSNGEWGSCSGAVYPKQEVCDDKDNDCDGKTDEGGVCTPSCSNECTSGEKQCHSGGVRMCGNYDSDSCTEWSSVNACDSDETCSNGQCKPNPPSCSNECTAGTKQCYNGGVRLCGYFDNDSCSEWSGTSQCSTGDTCQSGNCVPQQPSCTNECTPGLKVCSGNGVKLCGYFDNDSCSEWSSPSACSTGQTCQSGVCK